LLIGAFVALATFTGGLLFSSPLVVAVSASLGLLTSILILLSSSMLYNRPEEHFVWGWLILFFGLVGFGPWNFFGAYAIGSVLSIAGGFYGLAFQPYQVPVSSAGVPESGPTPPSFLKNCIHCGTSIPIAAETCISCGKPQKRV
jgi:hypothetical protein